MKYMNQKWNSYLLDMNILANDEKNCKDNADKLI